MPGNKRATERERGSNWDVQTLIYTIYSMYAYHMCCVWPLWVRRVRDFAHISGIATVELCARLRARLLCVCCARQSISSSCSRFSYLDRGVCAVVLGTCMRFVWQVLATAAMFLRSHKEPAAGTRSCVFVCASCNGAAMQKNCGLQILSFAISQGCPLSAECLPCAVCVRARCSIVYLARLGRRSRQQGSGVMFAAARTHAIRVQKVLWTLLSHCCCCSCWMHTCWTIVTRVRFL